MKKRKTNKAKQVDPHCRNHGSCPICNGNRTFSNKKREVEAVIQIRENSNDKRKKLTSEQLDSCNDRELDALIVEMVTHESTCPWHGGTPADDVPLYSSNTSLIGELVSRWHKDNPDLCLEVLHSAYDLNVKYKAIVRDRNNRNTGLVIAEKTSEHLHRAICIALILAEQEK